MVQGCRLPPLKLFEHVPASLHHNKTSQQFDPGHLPTIKQPNIAQRVPGDRQVVEGSD